MMLTQAKIKSYFEADLFKELGMEGVTSEEKMMFLEKIGEVVQQRLLVRLMEELTDDQKTALEAVISDPAKDYSEIAQFLALEIPNFQQISEEEIALYKKELIDRYRI